MFLKLQSHQTVFFLILRLRNSLTQRIYRNRTGVESDNEENQWAMVSAERHQETAFVRASVNAYSLGTMLLSIS